MARHFTAASSEKITLGLGQLGFAFGPGTVAAVFRRTTTGVTDFLVGAGATTTARFALQINATGNVVAIQIDSGTIKLGRTAVASGKWYLAAATKDTGTTTPRYHIYDYTTGIWVHEDAIGTSPNSTAAATSATLGCNSASTAFFGGDLAQAAVWNAALADLQVESLATDLSLGNWNGYAEAVGFWRPDPSPSVAVVDLSGGGANQSAIVGTTATADEFPLFNDQVVERTLLRFARRTPLRLGLSQALGLVRGPSSTTTGGAAVLPLDSSAAVSATSLVVTASTQVPLDASAAVSTPALAVTTQTQIPLAAAAGVSAATLNLTVGGAIIPLDAAAATSTTTLAVTATTAIPLGACAAVATSQLTVSTSPAASPLFGTLLLGAQPPAETNYLLLRPGREPLRLTPISNSLRFTTLAVGGFGSASLNLPGPANRWAREIPYLSKLIVTAGVRTLYEGQVEDLGHQISNGSLVTTLTCFGYQRRLDESKLVRIWSKRDMQWEDNFLDSAHPGAWNVQTGRYDRSDLTKAGVLFVGADTIAVDSAESRKVFWWAPSGASIVKAIFSWSRTGSASFHSEAGSANTGGTVNQDWTGTGASGTEQSVSVSLPNAIYVAVEADSGSTPTPHGADTMRFYDMRILCTSLNEEAGTGLTAGFYGGTLLRDLIAIIPDLRVGVIEAGTDFLIPQAGQDQRDAARSLVDQIASYYTREWAVWEDGVFTWTDPNLDEVQWITRLADLTDLDLQWSVDEVAKTIYLSYQDAGAAQGLALQSQAEQSASSSDQRNPYVKQSVAKDMVVDPGFPMTAASASQLASRIASDSGGPPLVTGEITLPAKGHVQHAVHGALPAIFLRSGDNLLIADLPKTEPLFAGQDGETLFHIVSTDYDETKDQVRLELQGYAKRADTLLARLAAVTRVLTG